MRGSVLLSKPLGLVFVVLTLCASLYGPDASPVSRSDVITTRKRAVRDARQFVWTNYHTRAFGADEFRPLNGTGAESWGHVGCMILDSMDTLWLMDLKDEFEQARAYVHSTLSIDHMGEVSVFETIIRALGGLLSAYDLSGDRVFLVKAVELADRLLPAINTTTSRAFYYLDTTTNATSVSGSLAATGSYQLEFEFLSKATGDPKYATLAKMFYPYVHSLTDVQLDGLFVNYIDGADGVMTFGGGGDSFYEYLLKVWLFTGKKTALLKEMYTAAIDGMQKHLLRTSSTGHAFLGDLDFATQTLESKMSHLACFVPGLLTLGAQHLTETNRSHHHIAIAKELMDTCYNVLYRLQPSRLSPEYVEGPMLTPPTDSDYSVSYRLRPEVVESLYVMHALTGDPKYQDWGWHIFQAIDRNCKVPYGYAQYRDVRKAVEWSSDPETKAKQQSQVLKNKMDTFFSAETLKYLYLLFDPENPYVRLDTLRLGMSMVEEASPFNRLIGEKDVLAAITSEFLDENATRKDTAAATVCLGRVFMTTYRFQFVPDPHEYELVQRHLLHRPIDEIESYFTIPLGCIASVKKKSSVIEIVTKDLRQQSYRFDVVEVTKIYTVLTTYVFPNKIDYLFAFYHRLSTSATEEREVMPCAQDWFVYDAQVEWQREGVMETGKWRVSYINEGFREIDTYPELLVVPASVPDTTLAEAAAFRSLGRIPCLAWYNKLNGATISRSSQPKVGMSKATSPSDEALVAGIAASSLLADSLHIIDCRPMSNAVANRAKGYGVESTDNYKNCTVSFMNIPNIHSMRDSLKKLRTLALSTTTDNLQWLGSVEDTKWLVYVRQLLKSAMHIATLVRDGHSVLVHCSHGWDRTSQLSALAQLFLDPFFRSWRGFQVLIEKEWLSFGHPFQLRLSHGEKADTQESPIFIQFLDCVWQLVRLFPSYFEFNEAMLLMLAEALHSCRFGTFLLDCKKLRVDAALESRTVSVWTWINGFRTELSEPTYKPNQQLSPSVSGLLRRVTLWETMILRWSAQPLLNEPKATHDFFAEHKLRILTWQLPRVAWNALNADLAVKMRDAEGIQQLTTRLGRLSISRRANSMS